MYILSPENNNTAMDNNVVKLDDVLSAVTLWPYLVLRNANDDGSNGSKHHACVEDRHSGTPLSCTMDRKWKFQSRLTSCFFFPRTEPIINGNQQQFDMIPNRFKVLDISGIGAYIAGTYKWTCGESFYDDL
jgi:hypothetical protein